MFQPINIGYKNHSKMNAQVDRCTHHNPFHIDWVINCPVQQKAQCCRHSTSSGIDVYVVIINIPKTPLSGFSYQI